VTFVLWFPGILGLVSSVKIRDFPFLDLEGVNFGSWSTKQYGFYSPSLPW
jgi:hypothetical protein